MKQNLMNAPAPGGASTAEKQLVARYLAHRPTLRQSMKKAPPCPLSWWGLLRQAEVHAGIFHRPPLRAV
ncbi:hypothetical protein [Azonexus sp.]|uniref:hypothetical protein n=1 Tax=Azonexus sp. TaxID=1872668 RepID=UPI0035AF5B2A